MNLLKQAKAILTAKPARKKKLKNPKSNPKWKITLGRSKYMEQ
jgi:hypothetical protein